MDIGGGELAVGGTGGELVTKSLGVGEGKLRPQDKPIPHLCFWPLSRRREGWGRWNLHASKIAAHGEVEIGVAWVEGTTWMWEVVGRLAEELLAGGKSWSLAAAQESWHLVQSDC